MAFTIEFNHSHHIGKTRLSSRTGTEMANETPFEFDPYSVHVQENPYPY